MLHSGHSDLDVFSVTDVMTPTRTEVINLVLVSSTSRHSWNDFAHSCRAPCQSKAQRAIHHSAPPGCQRFGPRLSELLTASLVLHPLRTSCEDGEEPTALTAPSRHQDGWKREGHPIIPECRS
ncbi:hypothetical protein CHARACLAT_016288 [Characodon lateralis]|uniref:Uncharacterized protein n=1 Tax=Characodon lateralis TaxID=208331 RepID=A0ABU7DJ12_9TELE|nr:hypothetical protein [Characodon lateralis]